VIALYRRYLALAARRPGPLCAGFFALALVALGFARRLELHTDMAELLPRDHPAVAALHQLAEHRRLGSHLVIVIDSPEREQNLAFLKALRPKLEALVPAQFAEIEWGRDHELADWKHHWRWMYADRASIERAEELLDQAYLTHASPFAIDLDEDDPKKELRALFHRLDDKPGSQSYELDRDGENTMAIRLWRASEGLAGTSDRRAFAAVRAAIDQTHPTQFHPALRVRLGGGIAQAIEDQESIRDDLTLATAICTLLILAAIFFYFRRVALVAVVGAPAILGLLVSLAIAAFTLGALNLNTAFLISIILGNGINSPIILLARFGEARASGATVGESLEIATTRAFRGTLAAMGAAAIAYGSLMATDFRGLSQFGSLGGAGMLLVWICTFLLVPPLVHLGERLRPGLLTPRGGGWERPFRRLREAIAARPNAVLVGALALAALALIPVRRLERDPIEWNLRALRTEQNTSRELWNTIDLLGMKDPDAGYAGSHAALLAERADQADALADALLAQDRALGDPIFLRARTYDRLLPREQNEKLAALARVRAKIDRRAPSLSEAERRELLDFRPPDDLRPLTVEDLPPIARRAFTERDGTVGRMVLLSVDPARYSDWNGHDLLRLSQRLRVDALGRSWVAASPASVFAGMIEILLRDGPRVAAIALAGVVLFALAILGRRSARALATQALALLYFGAALGLLRLRINFFNFVALPITLGVGADYSANLVVVPESGPAVALCSLTTILGYSSLLFSTNPALRSFGIVADLGEVCCLATALICLPALAAIRRR
jgi:predicted RND superfamily exporter protein